MPKFLLNLSNNNNDSYELKVFNIVQSIYFFGLFFLCRIIYTCINDPLYLYITILMIFIIFISFIDANRTKETRKCIVLVSLITNFLYLPLCYYGFGKLICCIPIYFILGILYTVLLIDGRTGIMLSVIQCFYLVLVINLIGKLLPDFTEAPLTLIDYFAISVAIAIVGVMAALSVSLKNKQYEKKYKIMQDTKLEVIDAYNSKDIFFANTSHEIRTPLNAIVGTVNLLLNENLDAQVKDNVLNILNSCNALLSITDELMTLSNTDNEDVSIMEKKYNFSDILTDIINMMSVRLMESGVGFYVELDDKLPKYLYGDQNRIRTLFINILNNAVKYTKEGKIILRVLSENIDSDTIDLRVSVEDTGIGIKEEALNKIFNDYKRDEEDSEKRNIEGTGLGLSLCKDIVEKMGGSISVQSEYHVGSTFYFNIHQKCIERENIAVVKDTEKTATIIFENDKEHAEALAKILNSLNITSIIVNDRMEFENSIMTFDFHHLFISTERYMENQRFIERKIHDRRIVVISDISQSVHINRSCYVLTRPAHLINVVNAYNNENNGFSREIIKNGGFTCPNTTILVVDDNFTNLEVASGLLKKYDATIVTAISGAECISTIEKMHVDIVFLDYMMPEMNGIDTIYAIRALELTNAKTVPVVALTANVVSGAKEMFMDAGFSDYISKPIDVNKLEQTLKTLLPREQLRIKL
ncbi:MAG: ATP-binding protein [Lachnospiraceae bacterium]|nr:ATP-binding protein [Lachnospiraceae bacterium]MDY5216888.1 ATP-binding protein [Lachnospiraceae bacterium]